MKVCFVCVFFIHAHFLQKVVNKGYAAHPKQMFVINKLVRAKINK